MEKPEILAPAGSMEALRAAISAGADAVYIGGSGFGARAYADNPDTEAMLEAIEYVHLRGKRLYLTVNTLVKEQEFGALYQFLAPYYAAGLDAAIVQDVGVLHFLAREFPGLSLHASTQMTLTGAAGLSLFYDYPVTRLVPARELSLPEIAEICKNSGKEVEIFVHGALCYCYSGQCLMSSLIGGRSGNRGRCAQPCRMEYDAEKGKKYWLSPKDLCGLPVLPELLQTGAASFKIEGRMKRPEYAAAVTAAYRRFTDLYFALGDEGYRTYLKEHPQLLSEEVEKLSDLYNRGGFTEGCFLCHNGAELMSVHRPNHFGVPVGKVVEGSRGEARIRLTKEVFAQDVLELRRENRKEAGGQGYYEYTVGCGGAAGTEIKARLLPTISARPGDMVYRMKNSVLLKELEDTYVGKEKKQRIQGAFYAKAGEPCTLSVWTECGGGLPAVAFPQQEKKTVSVSVEGFVCEKAEKLPATEEAVAKQLKKTGNDCFEFDTLEITLADNVFLPNGLLNELRRNALARLAEEIRVQYMRGAKAVREEDEKEETNDIVQTSRQNSGPYLDCVVSTVEQAQAAADAEGVRRVYLEYNLQETAEKLCTFAAKLKKAGKELWIALPRICRRKTLERLKAELMLYHGIFDGYLVRNYETLSMVMEKDPQWRLRICLDSNLYVMNHEAKRFYRKLFGTCEGICTAPLELSKKELRALGISDMTLVVYGKLPLMVSAHCVKKTMGYCTGAGNRSAEPVILTDRVGKRLSVRQFCKDCYNVLYNSECLALSKTDLETAGLRPWAIRLDFTFETAGETKRVLQGMTETGAFPGGTGYTRGHFKRGVE